MTNTDRTMTALRAHRRGGPEVLEIESAPVPFRAAGEVLVEVHAAAITFAELDWDLSWQTRDGRDRTPVIPSHEFSGVVVETGPRDGSWTPALHEAVFGFAPFDRDGAAANFVAVSSRHLAAKPAAISHAEAATLPVAAATAWQALVHHAAVRSGERVLVLGGGGGVGAFGVQVALHLGAEVAATAFAPQIAYVRSLGPVTVASELSMLARHSGPFDVVLDTVGGAQLEQAYHVLRPAGRLVTLQAPPDPELVRAADVEAVFFVVDPDTATLSAIANLVEVGALRPEIAATYPLWEGRTAYASGATSPRPPGKTVLLVR